MTRRYFLPVLFLFSSSIMADDFSQTYTSRPPSAYSGSETNGFTVFAEDGTNDKKQIQTKSASGDQSMTIVDSNGNLKIVQPPAPPPRNDNPFNTNTSFKESTPPLSSTAPTIPSPPGTQPPASSSASPPSPPSGTSMPNPTAPNVSVPVSTPSLPAPTRVPTPQPPTIPSTVPAPAPLTTVPEPPSAPTIPVPPAAPSTGTSSTLGAAQGQGNNLSR